MKSTIIKVQNISKEFQIGRNRSNDLRSTLMNKIGKLLTFSNRKEEKFWAIKDVSFNIEQGEVVGIIGSNGAGKSTLLKILSRITLPTLGRVEITGKVSSLLEVGTGFHPELTGRENVFLNGALLGMRKEEIKNRFDEIVAFSGIKKFIDTPVKHYSSGMYVRLAFAVAAHLEPDILLVDEVLSVGDAEFRRKSLRKMNGIAQGGKTVVFVSHNLSAISSMCSRVIVLDNGQISIIADPKTAISTYLSKFKDSLYFSSNDFKLSFVRNTQSYRHDEQIEVKIERKRIFEPILFFLALRNYEQNRIFVSEKMWKLSIVSWKIVIPANLLMEGKYFLEITTKEPVSHKIIESSETALSFNIISRDILMEKYKINRLGFIADPLKWIICD